MTLEEIRLEMAQVAGSVQALGWMHTARATGMQNGSCAPDEYEKVIHEGGTAFLMQLLAERVGRLCEMMEFVETHDGQISEMLASQQRLGEAIQNATARKRREEAKRSRATMRQLLRRAWAKGVGIASMPISALRVTLRWE